MSDAAETQGFKLEIAVNPLASPLVYTEVKEITGFQGFGGQASEIDTTHLQSPAKESIMGLQDFGTFDIDTNYLSNDPGQKLMRAAKAARTKQHFLATYSNGSTDEFDGFVLSGPKSGGVDAKIDGSFSIRVTGEPVFTDAP